MVICRGDPITIRQLEGNDTLTAQTLFHPFPPRAKPAKLSSLTFSNSLLSFISLLSSVHYYYSLSLIFFSHYRRYFLIIANRCVYLIGYSNKRCGTAILPTLLGNKSLIGEGDHLRLCPWTNTLFILSLFLPFLPSLVLEFPAQDSFTTSPTDQR